MSTMLLIGRTPAARSRACIQDAEGATVMPVSKRPTNRRQPSGASIRTSSGVSLRRVFGTVGSLTESLKMAPISRAIPR